MTQLLQVAPDKIGAVWPHVQKHLESMAERSRGKVTAEDIAALCASGHMTLWVVLDDDGTHLATAATELFDYPRKRVCRITGLVGEHFDKWLHHIEDIENWARSQGCMAMQNLARKGWARKVPDYVLTHVLLERDL